MGSVRDGTLIWLQRREIGHQPRPGQATSLTKNLYSSVQVVSFYSPFSNHSDGQHHGGIFNFDFSSDGRVLVAACEKRSFLVFDPFNGKLVQTKNGAHMNCVNCVKFLDTRTFATCSDDNTVALWDLRFLGSKVRSLHGHSYWVKNIEYAASRGLLVTSGFDGTIYTWDINNYSNEDGCRRVFYTDGLMRSKLTPDDSKLVVATADGYLIIVHNLDLEHLDTDTADFKLHFTESMQETGTSIVDSNIKHMFERSRNRVELLSDFPKGDKALVITSLQVHPQGWCVSSRNTSSDESSEWTCVHDISEGPLSPSFRSNTRRSRRHVIPMSAPERQQAERVDRGRPGHVEQDDSLVQERLVEPHQSEESGARHCRRGEGSQGQQDSSSSLHHRLHDDQDDESAAATVEDPAPSPRRRRRRRWRVFRLRLSSEDAVSLSDASSSADQDSTVSTTTSASLGSSSTTVSSREAVGRSRANSDTDAFILRLLRQAALMVESSTALRHVEPVRLLQQQPRSYSVHVPRPRLQFFQQEPNVGRGYIKEQCFSADGRLVVSPYANGLRLLAFDARCSELCDCPPVAPGQARQLHELTSLSMHAQVALTTRFSPTQCMFVSGALDGSVAFLQPSL